MLRVEDLRVERGGKTLFSNLSFDLDRGEALEIRGKNGSGKSTLAAILAGDLKPSEGIVSYSGVDSDSVKAMAKFMGVLFQNTEISFPITVGDFISLANPEQPTDAVINRLDLTEIANKEITKISAGQLQRTQIAQLIHQDPDLLILDEPFSAQDSEQIKKLIEIFSELKSMKKTLILINHIDLDLRDLIDKHLDLD